MNPEVVLRAWHEQLERLKPEIRRAGDEGSSLQVTLYLKRDGSIGPPQYTVRWDDSNRALDKPQGDMRA